MSLFDDGLVVLQIAAAAGNRTSQAILDELRFREERITALHEATQKLQSDNKALQEINSELNTQLRELRLQALQKPAGFERLFNGDFVPGVTRAQTVRQGAE